MGHYTPCAYHPNVAASNICERCRRPICSTDVRLYTKWRGGRYHRVKIYRRYCVPCNAAVLQRDASLEGQFPGIIVLAFIVLIAFTIQPFFALLIIAFVAIGYFNQKSKADRATAEATSFQQSTTHFRTVTSRATRRTSSTSTRYSPTSTSQATQPTITSASQAEEESSTSGNFSMICFECGEKLLLSDKFCPNCGDSTQEELQAYYLDKQRG